MKRFVCKHCYRDFARRVSHTCNGVKRDGSELLDSELCIIPRQLPLDLSKEQIQELEKIRPQKHYLVDDGGLLAIARDNRFKVNSHAIYGVLEDILKSYGVVSDVLFQCSPIRQTLDFPLPTQKITIEFEYCNITKDGKFVSVDKQLLNLGYNEL